VNVLYQAQLLPRATWQKAMWLLCEEPTSSTAARLFAVISMLCILVSITNLCVETLPTFERQFCVNVTADGGRTYHIRPNYAVCISNVDANMKRAAAAAAAAGSPPPPTRD